MNTLKSASTLALIAAALLSGCGGGGGDDDSAASQQSVCVEVPTVHVPGLRPLMQCAVGAQAIAKLPLPIPPATYCVETVGPLQYPLCSSN